MSEIQTVVTAKKSSSFGRVAALRAAIVSAVVLSTSSAFAVDNITALGEGATSNLSAALAVALAIFAVGIGIVGTFKGYAYLKSGVNKA